MENIQSVVAAIISSCPVPSISAPNNNQLQFYNQLQFLTWTLIELHNKDTTVTIDRLYLAVKLNKELQDSLHKTICLRVGL